MHNPEIEKLAHEWMKDNAPKVWNESAYLEVEKSFKAGYLKGVETERKRCLEIANKTIERYSDPMEGKGALFYMCDTREQIERGSDE